MNLSLRAEKTLLVAVLWVVFGAGYFTLNTWNQSREAHSVAIGLDHEVAFSPAWILPYVFVYIFILIPVPIVRHRGYFRRVALAYLAVMAVSFAIFAAFPVRYPRPDLAGEVDGFFSWAVGLNYALDHPNNCFPSLHIGIAYLAAFACWRLTRPVGAISFLIATAIAISTLFVKQHYVLDVVAGLVIAWVAYRTFLAAPACSCTSPM